jgi:hypothetical protein
MFDSIWIVADFVEPLPDETARNQRIASLLDAVRHLG